MAQMCPHVLASTWSKLAGGRLAEVENFWHKARGVVPALSIFIVRPSEAEPKSLKALKNNARNHRYSVMVY